MKADSMLAKRGSADYTVAMNNWKNLLFSAAALAVVAPAAAELEWMTDLPAAQERAAAEGKLVLVDFTGSDWCGWCVRLHKDVFDTPEFEAYVADKFVLNEVDVPQNPAFDKELRARNEELCSRFGIDGFPTLMVLTPQGTVTGGFVGGREDLAAVQEPLEAARANAEALQAAQALEGLEKAKALYAVYQAIPEELQGAAKQLCDDIVALDAEDVTGMQATLRAAKQKAAMLAELEATHGSVSAMLPILERYLAEAEPANRGAMLNLKAQLQLTSADSLEDIAAAKATALEAIACEPETAEENKAGVERTFADPAALLEKARRFRADRAKKQHK